MEWKRKVNKACEEKSKNDCLDEFKDKSKSEDIVHEGADMKDYMNTKSVSQGREVFRIRTHMVKGIKAKFKNMCRDSQCEGCLDEVDSQSHVMVCTAYARLMLTRGLVWT